MSYRDPIEAQRKYIRTKKEAREAKLERERNPRPPRYDPPPVSPNIWVILTLAFFTFLPLISLFFLLPATLATQTPSGDLTVWIYGNEQEFEQIKNWLEPEILANELAWTVNHATTREHFLYALRNAGVDLAIVEEDFAGELYEALALAPLSERLEGATWENSFVPFWEPEPFRKTFGWIVPANGRIAQGRHLFTVIRQFAQPFSPS